MASTTAGASAAPAGATLRVVVEASVPGNPRPRAAIDPIFAVLLPINPLPQNTNARCNCLGPEPDECQFTESIPALQTSPTINLTSSIEGRIHEAFVLRDEVRRPRARQRMPGTRAAPGLRPGPIRVPARSWLTYWLALSAFVLFERVLRSSRDRRLKQKARPGAVMKTPLVARREAPACPATEHDTIGFALFGAPLPSSGRNLAKPGRVPRRGDDRSRSSSEAVARNQRRSRSSSEAVAQPKTGARLVRQQQGSALERPANARVTSS